MLVHGIGSRWQVWEPIIDTLATTFEVIAVDLPGFGESEPLAGTTVDALTDALAEFLAAEGITRPHLVGNSMGGLIALQLGARGLARSVTAFSPIGFWHTAGRVWCQQSLGKSVVLAGLLDRTLPTILGTAVGRTVFLGLVFGKPWAVGKQIAADTARVAAAAPGFGAALASFRDAELREPGALADIPVTVAWGNRDILLTYRTQHRRAQAALPGARHLTLRGSGHTPFYDDPSACAAAVLDHITG
ncbi:alpha/beta fold hydrolase [Nocardia callitridis]|uniref:Alpha/beta fold hydrolase n=1 Tax=Nocardia callitridis TaxID=648753 RepID=A0ABP9JZD1_9NOCA